MTLVHVTDLTKQEACLIDCVSAGEALNLTGQDDPIWRPTPAAALRWPANRVIRATVLRDILIGRYHTNSKVPDPNGIRLSGAIIKGRLEIDHITTTVPLRLSSCYIPEGISAHTCSIPTLAVIHCTVGSKDRKNSAPTINIVDSKVSGKFLLSGSTLSNREGVALDAGGLRVESDMALDSFFCANGHSKDGAIRLLGADIGGQLSLDDARINNDIGPAIAGDRLHVASSMFIRNIKASADSDLGTIRLPSAEINGQLNFRGSRLINNSGSTLLAGRLKVNNDLLLDNNFYSQGSGTKGGIYLQNAQILGEVKLIDSMVSNSKGPAFNGESIIVGNDLTISGPYGRKQPVVTSNTIGEIAPKTSRVNDSEETLSTELIRLSGAQIGGNLRITCQQQLATGTMLLNAEQSSVGLDSIFDLHLADYHYEPEFHAVNLNEAKISGKLRISWTTWRAAMTRARWSIDGLTLSSLSVTQAPQKSTLKHSSPAKMWTQFVHRGTTTYAAQPYRLLAAHLVQAGHKTEAYEVLIKQRHRRLGTLKPLRRTQEIVLYSTVGYGYRPFFAMFWLTLCLLAAVCFIAASPAGIGVVEDFSNSISSDQDPENTKSVDQLPAGTNPSETNKSDCSGTQKFFLAVDAAIPLVSTTVNDNCRILLATSLGDKLAFQLFLVKIFAWAFAALFVAGFTSIVRKE